jgi:hypothetical protein
MLMPEDGMTSDPSHMIADQLRTTSKSPTNYFDLK